MAERADLTTQEFVEKYKDRIEKILGREIRVEDFNDYKDDLKAIMDSFNVKNSVSKSDEEGAAVIVSDEVRHEVLPKLQELISDGKINIENIDEIINGEFGDYMENPGFKSWIDARVSDLILKPKADVVKAVNNWWKRGKNAKSNVLAKAFDENGDIQLDTPEALLDEFITSKRNDFSDVLKEDEFLTQLMYQNIMSWQTQYIVNCKLKENGLEKGYKEVAKKALNDIYKAQNDRNVEDYIDHDKAEGKALDEYLFESGIDDSGRERITKLVEENIKNGINTRQTDEFKNMTAAEQEFVDDLYDEIIKREDTVIEPEVVSQDELNMDDGQENQEQAQEIIIDPSEVKIENVDTSPASSKKEKKGVDVLVDEKTRKEVLSRLQELANENKINNENIDEILNEEFADYMKNPEFRTWVNERVSDIIKTEESQNKEEELDQSGLGETGDLGNGGEISSNLNEFEAKYKEVDTKINSVENGVKDVINRYISENNIRINLTGNIEEDAVYVKNILSSKIKKGEIDESVRSSFIADVNSAVSNIKDIKKEIADEYIKITEEGIKLLRETAEKIQVAEKELDEKRKELEEKENKIKELEDKLDSLQSELSKDVSEEIENVKAEIEKYSNEVITLKGEIGEAEKNLEKQKDAFESSKENYLSAAESVKSKLEEKGIIIGSNAIEKENPTKESATTTQQYTQNTSTTTQQQAQGTTTQNAGTIQQQMPDNNASDIVVATDLAIDIGANYNQIIAALSKTPAGSGLDHEGYQKAVEGFKNIIANPSGLTSTHKKWINKYLKEGRQEIFEEMKKTFENERDVLIIRQIIGDDNLALLENHLGAKTKDSEGGNLLVTKGFGFDAFSPEEIEAVQDAIEKCYGALDDETLNDFRRSLINDKILKPLRFACIDQYGAVATRNKIQQIFRLGRKHLDPKTVSIDELISEKDKEITDAIKANEEISSGNEPVIENEREQEMVIENEQVNETQPKSFRDMLGDLINSTENIDLKSKLNVDVKDEPKINWNKRYNNNKTAR